MCIFLKLTIIILGVREYLNGKLCNKHRAKDFPFFDSEAVVWLFFFCNSPAQIYYVVKIDRCIEGVSYFFGATIDSEL